MSKYIDKGTARQHLTDRLMESALNNVGIRADVDAVFLDIAKNRLPVWIDELQTYDVQEIRHGRWELYDICSVCGAQAEQQTNYCPNCGSRMDLEGENDDTD